VSQTTADPVHLPFWQVSPVVHALLSSHAVPLGVVGFAHGFGMVVVVVVGPSVDVVTGGSVVVGPSVDVVTGGSVVVAGAKVVVVAGGAQSRRLCLHSLNSLFLHRCSSPLRRPLHDAAIVSPHIALQKRIEVASAVKGPIRARNSPRSSCLETRANNKDRQPVFICSLPAWLAIVGTRGAVTMSRTIVESQTGCQVGSGRFKQPDRTGFGHLTDGQRSERRALRTPAVARFIQLVEAAQLDLGARWRLARQLAGSAERVFPRLAWLQLGSAGERRDRLSPPPWSPPLASTTVPDRGNLDRTEGGRDTHPVERPSAQRAVSRAKTRKRQD
jgi:hypothetical protein